MKLSELKNFNKVKVQIGKKFGNEIIWELPNELEVLFFNENGIKKSILINNIQFNIEKDFVLIDNKVCFKQEHSVFLYCLVDIEPEDVKEDIKKDNFNLQELIKTLKVHKVKKIIFENNEELNI